MREKWWTPWFSFGAVYLLWRMWLFFVAFLASLIIPRRDRYLAVVEFAENLPNWITVWGNFDGVVFMRIAFGGYGLPEVPFFPLLPLMMRTLHSLGVPLVLGGMFTSLLSILGVVYVWRELWKLDIQNKQYVGLPFFFLLLVLLTFPTAHYFTAVYQDALFLFLSSSTILLARKRYWLWAVMAGMLAMLARLNGLALFFFLGAEYMIEIAPRLKQNWPWQAPFETVIRALDPRQLFKHSYVFLFAGIPLAFLAYLGFLQLKFGDWQVFFSSVEVWNRSQLTFPLHTAWRYFKILVLYANINLVYWVAFAEAVFTAFYAAFLALQWGRIRFSYWILMFFHLLIPALTGTFQGMPRYGLHLYPLFLVLGAWVWRKPVWFRLLYCIAMLLGQVLYISAFVRGYFVA